MAYRALLAALDQYYRHLEDLIKFVDTPSSSPRLGADGKLWFQTEANLATFRELAQKINSDLASVNQARLNMQALSRRQMSTFMSAVRN